jgi:telomere length regulation protein
MGSRELAGMSVPLAASARKVDFPSRTLPPALHQKYITDTDMPGQIESAVDGIRGLLLSKGARKGVDTVPELAREKRLKISTKRTLVAETGTPASRQMSSAGTQQSQRPVVPFKDVAAEYFILPLINHFWAFYQDSMTREERAKIRGDRYRGAGTGMILSPMALEKLLMTLVLMLHAARHSPVFLAILAPESLELAVMVANQRSTRADTTNDASDNNQGESGVIGAALELALVVLDASYDLDAGRTMATTKPALVSAVGEWASGLFKVEERGGERLSGQGGLKEGRVRSGAAGVVVKVSEIADKWGRFGMM